MSTSTLTCPQTLPDGTRCQGPLDRSKNGPWLEISCSACGYFASRHVDSTGPVREQEQGNDNTESRWWDR